VQGEESGPLVWVCSPQPQNFPRCGPPRAIEARPWAVWGLWASGDGEDGVKWISPGQGRRCAR
jgi:hypothetical protein